MGVPVYRGSQLSTISFLDFTSNHLEFVWWIVPTRDLVDQRRSGGGERDSYLTTGSEFATNDNWSQSVTSRAMYWYRPNAAPSLAKTMSPREPRVSAPIYAEKRPSLLPSWPNRISWAQRAMDHPSPRHSGKSGCTGHIEYTLVW